MWFDPDEPQREFSTDLFGYNPWALAYYLEPEGFREIYKLRGPRLDQYERHVPRTVEIARGMFGRIRQRHSWGTQIAPGCWTFERVGVEIKTKNGFRTGDSIHLIDVLKHLTGRSRFARGTTDQPIEDYQWNASLQRCLPNFVPTLRLDIDLDRAWNYEDHHSVMRELRSQRRVIEAAGLPYHVFRTGSRGVQVVVPLPLAVPPSLASTILHGIRSALEERGDRYVHPDKDNLHGLMRLPGGIHASSGELGLWIDVAEATLFPLEIQAEMMVSAFIFPVVETSHLSTEEFQASGSAMLRQITNAGVPLHHLLDREEAMMHLRRQPENSITLAVAKATAEARSVRLERKSEVEEWRKAFFGPTESQDEQRFEPEVVIQGRRTLTNEIAAAELQADPRAPVGTVEWAASVWLEEYEPGGHWNWVNMAGKKGILAATILFGADGAENAMLSLAHHIGGSPSELREREHTIRALWRSFGQKNFKPYENRVHVSSPAILGESDEEIETLASAIVSEMIRVQPKPRWNKTLALQLATVVLVGIRASKTGRLKASFGTIADSINDRWLDARCNRQRVAEMIARMTQGESSLVSAFFRIKGRRWNSESDEYGCGRFLRGTPLQIVSSEKLAALLASEIESEESESAGQSLPEQPSPSDSDLLFVDFN